MNASKPVVRLGIDLGKNSFHLWGVDAQGERALKKKLGRGVLLRELALLQPCLIGMEACSGAHHWAREFTGLGHEVRLMAPQFVTAYVKGNKNDYNDAEAICEAVGRPSMRFVEIKSIEQQDILSLHRMRQGAMKARTALCNQIRGLLAEFGVVMPKGVNALRRQLPEVLEDGENRLSVLMREELAELKEQLRGFDERIAGYDRKLEGLFRQDKRCERIAKIEGVGVLSASAVVASFGDGRQFESARKFSAMLGLVPAQHTTGDKPRLLGISKRGDRYLRTLLVHGARAAIRVVVGSEKGDARSRWIKRLVSERGSNRAAVALANKNARIIWALLSRDQEYAPAP